MNLDDIDYVLPQELIAQTPIEPRDSARLLVDRGSDSPDHRHVRDIVNILQPGDVLVVNHTRVMPARIRARRQTGGAVEVLLLGRHDEALFAWDALIKPGGKMHVGETLTVDGSALIIEVGERTTFGDTFVVRLSADDVMGEILKVGEVPLPPYITEKLQDAERYQTVYSHDQRSAAAPTAGLHFTQQLIKDIKAIGVEVVEVELVVGLDTFKPISTANPLDHVIHTEWYAVSQSVIDTCSAAKNKGGQIVAVGTTATRALESAATTGELSGNTQLFITPGYQWKIVDVLLTNFHMPKTTLLLMIEAFVGKRWKSLYQEAISQKYRMLSFGDAMLLSRATDTVK
jgi:S-adenosylmethionine:tRNA ribosyltransferase-isomerase